MLIKSFVTVALTTSYGNKNWELKLSREGNDTDCKLWNQGSGTIQSQQRAKGGTISDKRFLDSDKIYAYLRLSKYCSA